MKRALFIHGVAGSGKSTLGRVLAPLLDLKFYDADDFHPAANIEKLSRGQALSEVDREPWLQSMQNMLSQQQGQGLILAVPGLRQSHRQRLRAAAGPYLSLHLALSLEAAEQRLLQRGGFFGPALARSQFDMLESDREWLELDATRPLQDLAQEVRRAYEQV